MQVVGVEEFFRAFTIGCLPVQIDASFPVRVKRDGAAIRRLEAWFSSAG